MIKSEFIKYVRMTQISGDLCPPLVIEKITLTDPSTTIITFNVIVSQN